jgi:hypothetical protein
MRREAARGFKGFLSNKRKLAERHPQNARTPAQRDSRVSRGLRGRVEMCEFTEAFEDEVPGVGF